MQVTLKKAALLAGALAALTVPVPAQIAVSKFSTDGFDELFANNNREALKAMNLNLNIITARSLLRKLIGDANAGEINELIGLRAEYEKKLAFLNGLVAAKVLPDFGALGRERDAARNTTTTYGSDAIKMPILIEADVQPSIRTLKRLLANANERLAELNFTTKITLSDDLVAFLTEQSLI